MDTESRDGERYRNTYAVFGAIKYGLGTLRKSSDNIPAAGTGAGAGEWGEYEVDKKERLLQQWGQYIVRAAHQGALTGKLCPITHIEAIAGPRAGALEMQVGMGSGGLLQALRQHDAAALRQFVPWQFAGEPAAYMVGRFVRVEAGWPEWLAERTIRLDSLPPYPKGKGRWVAGRNENSQTIIAKLDDRTPHYLIGGTTGSGKSVALRNALLQLSGGSSNKLVLLDGKYGEGLRPVQHLQGVVGPVAVEGSQVRAALGWACQEMKRRHLNGNGDGHIVVAFDEFQSFVSDSVIVALMERIARQGRSANVHLLAATQHPTIDAFGSAAIRRCFTGKLALMVTDFDASKVAVGGKLPRADHLLGEGDCYAVVPDKCHRIQGAFVDGRNLDQAEAGEWEFDAWPEYDALDAGQGLPRQGQSNGSKPLRPAELGAALISAMEGEGRPAYKSRVEGTGLGKPGSDRARTLLALGRETLGWLEANNVGLVYLDDGEWKID